MREWSWNKIISKLTKIKPIKIQNWDDKNARFLFLKISSNKKNVEKIYFFCHLIITHSKWSKKFIENSALMPNTYVNDF